MELKDRLTNEAISKCFNNQFDLVNHAIGIAVDMIHAGRGPRVRTETENTALQVLEEILAEKDRFDKELSKENQLQSADGVVASIKTETVEAPPAAFTDKIHD
jgi:hypothetical protein